MISTRQHKSQTEALYVNYLASYGSKSEKRAATSVSEWERRVKIFLKNDKIIREWNSSEVGRKTVIGHNQFSDWEDHEYDSLLKRKQ